MCAEKQNPSPRVVATFGDRSVYTPPPPEQYDIANELEERVRRRLAYEDPKILRCLDGLIDGESIDDTAASIGGSPRLAKRLRQKARRLAAEVLLVEEAA